MSSSSSYRVKSTICAIAIIITAYMLYTSYLVISTIGETDATILKNIAYQQVTANIFAAVAFIALAMVTLI
jgi:hypothetical protein